MLISLRAASRSVFICWYWIAISVLAFSCWFVKIRNEEIVYYDFQSKSAMINPDIVLNRTFLADICSTAAKFWGKHSMLAIISYELDDKAEAYGKDSVIKELRQVLDELFILSGQLSIGTTGIEELHKQHVVQNQRNEKVITFEYGCN